MNQRLETNFEAAVGAIEQFKEYISDPQVWSGWLIFIIQLVVIVLISRLLVRVIQKALNHMMQEREKSRIKINQRRTQTIGRLMNNIVTYTVNFILILMILGQFGINLAPILAGAGVLGLAIGFGAQSLVKDVITGFFIIFEDQFAVGDLIQTGGFKGSVEQIGLRVTRLRSETGEVHIIPNGNIQQLTNFSIYNTLAVVDVTVSNQEDIDSTIEVLHRSAENTRRQNPELLLMPRVLGIQTFGTSESVIRITAECKSMAQESVERLLKKGFMEALSEYRDSRLEGGNQ